MKKRISCLTSRPASPFKMYLLLALLLTLGVGEMWAIETIPANTIIYVDVANLNNGDWDSDGSYFMSVTASDNSSCTTTASNTSGAGSYAPKKDTWITLSQVAGNLYAGKVSSQSATGKVSFWTKNESSYDNCWQVNAALAQSYESSKRKFTISSGHTNHGDRNTSCFGTTTSSIDLFTGGQKLYLRVGTNWKTKDGSGNSPRFAACFLGQSGQTWAKCTNVSGDYYTVTVPTTGAGEWPYVIFCRMNGGNTTDSWGNVYNQTNDLAPSSDGQGFNNCVWIADDAWSNSSSWTKYAPSPAVWKTDDHDYTTNKFVDGSVGISLSANTTYYFKIADGVEGGWWGCSDNDGWRKSFVGQSEKHTLFSGGIDAQKVLILKTAGAGIYTFYWNSSTHQISVTYPTVTHPSSDYIYFKNNRRWPNVMAHLFNGTPASTSWNALPVMDSINFDGTYYHYAAAGGSTSILAAKETTEAWDDKTADLTVSKGRGKWYDVVNKSTQSSEVDAKWKTFDATLTLSTGQGETTNPSPTSITVTYGANTNINTDVISTSPAKTGYTFGGYYTSAGGGGTQLINASEKIPTDVSGYTTSGNWTKTGSSVSATLYAKWTQDVVLDNTGYTTNGSTSVTLTYNSSSHAALTNPEKAGYTFGGWYTGSGGTGSLVINTSGVLQNSVKVSTTNYTDASGNWIYAGSAPTLYAKWTVIDTPLSFNASSDGNWSTAANWSPACVPTIEHDVVITKPVSVDVTNARAKSVVIYNDGSTHTGHLDIPAGMELVIAGTLRKTTDGSSYGATTENDVFINSSPSAGLGALVMGSHDGTNKATINFYSKSHGEKNNNASVAQYLGVPFNNEPSVLSTFYNSWVYRINDSEMPNMVWERMSGDDGLKAFKGYCVFAAEAEANPGHYFWMQGQLVASTPQSHVLYKNTESTAEQRAAGTIYYNNETLVANSWMAPIKINAFLTGDFKGAYATVYIFNAGSKDDYDSYYNSGEGSGTHSISDSGTGPGQYTIYTVGTAEDTDVIPAMQSFSVYTTGEFDWPYDTIFFDYTRLVYNPAVAGTTPAANRAPHRAAAETAAVSTKMRLFVQAESGYRDKLYMLEHEGFEQGFENGWDGHKMFGDKAAPQLYAITPDGNMAINCIPTFEGTVLGFKPGTEDTQYTFRFSYDGEEALYLNDLKEQQSTLINGENTYQFFTADDDLEARFVISATPLDAPAVATGVESTVQNAEARKLIIDNKLYIIRNGRIYDATGAIVL